MARQQHGRAGDYTGRLKAEGEAKAAAEREAQAQQLAMATVAAQPVNQEPIELETREIVTPDTSPVPTVIGEDGQPVAVDGLEVTAVDVSEEKVKFRVNETLEQVTIGYGNTYDFQEGQEYLAPRRIRDYLDDKGFIWH